MEKSLTIARYLISIIIVLAFVGLLVWYFYLKTQTDTAATTGAARGLDTVTPSFTGNTGSTYENVAQTKVIDEGTVKKNTGVTNAPPALWLVSQNPTAGEGFVMENSTLKLNFVERASGNVFSADLTTGKVERLTNTLMPKTYLASFAHDGAVLLRSVDVNGNTTLFAGTIAAKAAPATAEIASSSPSALRGEYLAASVTDLAVNPKAREVFYLLLDQKVGAIGIKSMWDGSGQKRLFESGIIGWQPLWLSDGRIVLVQKPAYDLPGSAYILEASGSLTPIIRGIPGLTALPRASSKTFVYGAATGGTLTLYVLKDKKDPELLPLKTVADKCVWSSKKDSPMLYCAVPQSLGSGNFIDNWLRGRIHTSDTWWEVNTTDDTAQILFTSESTSGNSIDVTQPMIDDSDRYISFMNGSDMSLWVLQIPDATSTASH